MSRPIVSRATMSMTSVKKAKASLFSAQSLLAGHLLTFLLTYILASTLMSLSSATFAAIDIQAPGKVAGHLAYASDRVLVKFKPGVSTAQATSALDRAESVPAVLTRKARFFNTTVVSVSAARADIPAIVKAISAWPDVEYAEPDYLLYAAVRPNDTYFNNLWGLENTGQFSGTPDADIDATEAWDTFTGDASLVVGVIDSGIDYTHPDLAANMWVNPVEIPNNGRDDDGNGYIDDIHGINAITGTGNPMDDNGHGTHCAGTIGAVGNNNRGIAGVAWKVKLMGLKFLDSKGFGFTSDAIEALAYVKTMKTQYGVNIKITSNSWGGYYYSKELADAISASNAAGILFVAAAGNDALNTDIEPHYPSSYQIANVISVASSDHNDALSSFSNYGFTSVDLAAPGSSIYSTIPNNSYAYYSGTSMATPHVAGAAALLLGYWPTLGVAEVKSLLMENVDKVSVFSSRMVSGGRINVRAALGEPNLILENETVSGYRYYLIAGTITAGPNYTIIYPGDVTLVAGQQILLRPGFSVRAGALFHAVIDPSLSGEVRSPACPAGQSCNLDSPSAETELKFEAPDVNGARLVVDSQVQRLTWSALPVALQAYLVAHDATVRDIQQDAEGESIVFATEVALLDEDDNDHSDVYHYVLATDSLSLVSLGIDGHAGNASSDQPRLDGLGRQLIYRSKARNLVPGTQNDFAQLYLYDLALGTMRRLTSTAYRKPSAGDNGQALVAGDWAIFRTEAPDLDSSGPGLYRQHLYDDSREPVGLDPWGQQDPHASHPAANALGSEIVYQRPEDDGSLHIYLTDAAQAERLSLISDPKLGRLEHCCAAISPDGRYITYREQAEQGDAWLHVCSRTACNFERVPWPNDDVLLDLAPQFNDDSSELWWVAPEQGPGLPEVLHKADSPFATELGAR